MTLAVADTGPLIHLAEVGALDLFELFDTVLVPVAVVDELDAGGRPEGFDSLDCEVAGVDDVGERWRDLDAGERAALAVADDRNGVLLTDDLDARDAAAEAGIEVHGSIGIIAFGYARERFTRAEAARLMRELQRETSLFVSDTVVERGIERLGDE